MDKKRQMAFNLNNFLLAMSSLLDFKSNDLNKTSLNHYKRVCFIALNIGKKLNLNEKEMADLCSYSLVYDLKKEDLEKLPFVEKANVFENDLIENIIKFSSSLDRTFNLANNDIKNRFSCIEFVKENKDNYSKEIVESFLKISSNISFFLDIQSENEIINFIYSNLSDFTTILDFEEIVKLSVIFHNLENKDSQILQRASLLADEFEFEHKDKQVFLISSLLQNIGKLAIPSSVLNKKEKLLKEEYELIKSYPYYTKKILNSIMGFADISSLASKVQERVDGSGYINAFLGKDLSFKDRILACLVIYSALREKRAYRNEFTHKEAIEIMKTKANNGKIDKSIVEIFEKIYS